MGSSVGPSHIFPSWHANRKEGSMLSTRSWDSGRLGRGVKKHEIYPPYLFLFVSNKINTFTDDKITACTSLFSLHILHSHKGWCKQFTVSTPHFVQTAWKYNSSTKLLYAEVYSKDKQEDAVFFLVFLSLFLLRSKAHFSAVITVSRWSSK